MIPIAPPAPQPGTPDPTAPESNEPKEKYIVQCNHCLWDSSKTPGWTFEKPTGLGAFAATAETRSPQAVAFGSLKQHFAAGLPQPEKEKKGQSKVVQLLAKASRKFGTGRGKEVEPRKVEKKEWSDPTHSAYVEIEGTDEERAEAYEKWLSEKAAAERTAALLARDENRVTTPEQRLAQPTQPFSNVGLIPPRTPLRFKKIKRCATCTGILTRPEQKAANTKWRVKNVARDVVPRVTIVPPIPEGEGVLVLRFANPADVEVEVTLRPQVDTVRPLVTKFTVPPKQEEGLYDPQPFLEPEELFLVVKRGGRVERKNWTAVAVELGETREFWMRMELRGAKVPGAWVWVSV